MKRLIFTVEEKKIIPDESEEIFVEEINVLKQLGLKCEYGEEKLNLNFIQNVRYYVAIYQKLYQSKTEMLSLQQLCVDKVKGPVNFNCRVNNYHLSLPDGWFESLHYRLILICCYSLKK